MLVKYWMRTDVSFIDATASMQDAVRLLKETGASLIPVMEKGRLVGVVTDRDLKRASASDATALDVHELIYLISRIKVKFIMSKPPITVPPDYTIEETSARLLVHGISGAPVVDAQDKVIGIISQREICTALTSLSGLAKRGVQLALLLEDRPGSIKEVTDIVRSYGGRLVSILTSYSRAPDGYRRAYLRAYQIDHAGVAKMLKDIRQKVRLLYVVDHKANTREIYEEPKMEITGSGKVGQASLVNGGKIVFATDFSENAAPARALAVDYAKALQADLDVLHVVDNRFDGNLAQAGNLEQVHQVIEERVDQHMHHTADECKAEWDRVQTHVRKGQPAVEIARFAAQQHAHLIVMGTHGWSGFSHVLLGSVAENVIRKAGCPVLVVRAA